MEIDEKVADLLLLKDLRINNNNFTELPTSLS